jgi:Ni,Fe-hydrogenase III large subunit
MKIKLREKVKLTSGELVNEIEIKEPTRGDLKAIQHIKGDLEKDDLLISRLTGISLSELDKMVVADSIKIQDELNKVYDADYDPKSI